MCVDIRTLLPDRSVPESASSYRIHSAAMLSCEDKEVCETGPVLKVKEAEDTHSFCI